MGEPKTRWTGGEISAMVAPMFDMSPEEIGHAAIIIHTDEGIEMFGCIHAKTLVEMVHRINATRNAFNPSTHYEGHIHTPNKRRFRNWLGSLLL